MFRYVVEYTTNSYHDTNYGTVFSDFEDSALFFRNAAHHLSSKCNEGSFAIKTIRLQHKVDGVWVDFE